MKTSTKIWIAGNIILFGLLFYLIIHNWDNIKAFSIPRTNNQTLINVTFSDDVKEQLKQYYGAKEEYMVCLDGYKTNNAYYIDRLSVLANGTTKEVTYPSICSGTYTGNAVGNLHSHPIQILGLHVCYPSGGDIKSWKFYDANISELTLFMIQCDKNKFVAYSSDNDFKEGVMYEI